MAYKGLLNLLTCTTRSSSVVTLVRPSISSSFIHSFYLTQAAWPIKHKTHIHTHNITNYQVDMQLPSSFRQPHPVHCPPGSPHAACITSSQSTTSLSSIYHSQGLHSRLQKPICSQILFLRSVFGSIQDCLRGSLTWILAFVCFSFFFIYIYIFFWLGLRVLDSADSGFQSTLKLLHGIVSYRITLLLGVVLPACVDV